MTRPDPNQTQDPSPVDALITDYLIAVEAGQVPNRQDLFDRFPEFASQLRAFFADYDRIDHRAGGLNLGHDTPAQRPTIKYFGDYELLEEIAEGGMGVVYKARQQSLGRVVALKLVSKGRLATPMDVARFQLEAEAAATLDHPNIVPIHEIGQHDGQDYFSMKFIDGPTLGKWPRGHLRAEVGLMETVCRAVHHAHQAGILHRDLKPSNILLDQAGTPYVSDFGLAKRLDAGQSLTETGQLIGTAGYLPPEQALGQKGLTVIADVFSLGAVLYERLTGQPAFPGATILERLHALHETETPRPTALVPNLPRDLETVCLKCLEREPRKRYPTAEELADDLARWRNGEPIRARRVGAAERAWLWCRRNPVVTGLGTATALALASGTVVSTYFAIRAEHRRAEAVANLTEARRNLVRGWLRPVGIDVDRYPNLGERIALRELAETNDDGLRDLFLRMALARDVDESTALRVAWRSEMIARSVAGLSERRRQRALAIIEPILDDRTVLPAVRFAALQLAIDLGSERLETAAELFAWLRPKPNGNWESHFQALLGRCDGRQAVLLVPLWEAVLREPGESSAALEAARDGLEVAGWQQTPGRRMEWNRQVAEQAVELLAKSENSSVISACGGVLSAAAARLDPAAASAIYQRAAERAVEHLKKTNNPYSFSGSIHPIVISAAAYIGPTSSRHFAQQLLELNRSEFSEDSYFQYERFIGLTALTANLTKEHAESVRTGALNQIQKLGITTTNNRNNATLNESIALTNCLTSPASLATVLQHPQCAGEFRDATLRRLESIAFPPTPLELAPSIVTGAVDPVALGVTTAAARLHREQHRRFRTVRDAAAWLRQHHPEFDLDAPFRGIRPGPVPAR